MVYTMVFSKIVKLYGELEIVRKCAENDLKYDYICCLWSLVFLN